MVELSVESRDAAGMTGSRANAVNLLTAALLAAVVALACLSSDQATRLGIETLRMPLFVAVVVALCGLGFVVRPQISEREMRVPVALALLLALIALLDLRGRVDPLDYKMALAILVLVTARSVRTALGPVDLPLLVWRTLSVYVVLTALTIATSDLRTLARGADGIVRIDASGSLVTHSALCLTHLVLCATTFARSGLPGRLARLMLGGLALAMLLLAATRTPFLTAGAAALILAAASPDRRRFLPPLLAIAAVGIAALALHTALVDDSLWRRLSGSGQAEWSTGRSVSVERWLAAAADHPLGLGLGTIRETLADGKPELDDGEILDWPHNEAVRFWVEAGPPGLAFLLLLLGSLGCRAVATIRAPVDLPVRALAALLLADALTQAMFQNWLNSVYYSTYGILLIGLLAAGTHRSTERTLPTWRDGSSALGRRRWSAS